MDTIYILQEESTNDELFLQKTLIFAEGLKDLKKLRTQLYSAADYFEVSYQKNDQKQPVVDFLKDYTVKALVNAVDHLGSVTHKVNGLLNEKVDEVSSSDLLVSIIEQRIRTCQEHIDHGGLSQQSLNIQTPKHHKRYVFPGEEFVPISGSVPEKCQEFGIIMEEEKQKQFPSAEKSIPFSENVLEKCQEFSLINKGNLQKQFESKCQLSSGEERSPVVSKMHPPSPSLQHERVYLPDKSTFFSVSVPHPLNGSGFLATRHINPSPVNITWQQNLCKPPKSASMCLHAKKDEKKKIEVQPSKSKGFLGFLLSRRNKPKIDHMLYNYLDEY